MALEEYYTQIFIKQLGIEPTEGQRELFEKLGKFLVPEFARELGMDINDLERLRPLAEKLDEKHLYENVIYDAYIENGCWGLTDEQRIEAYRIYNECKEQKVED